MIFDTLYSMWKVQVADRALDHETISLSDINDVHMAMIDTAITNGSKEIGDKFNLALEEAYRLLKHNNLGYLKDSLESRIISIDTNFNVIAINSFPILPQGIKELWDEYINAKIEASESAEKARNLKILYGE